MSEAKARKVCCVDGREPAPTTDPAVEEAAALFKALADENRLGILRQLRREGEVCACEFLPCCGPISQPTMSHHLKVLREAGLIVGEKRGLWIHYRLNAEKIERLRALLP